MPRPTEHEIDTLTTKLSEALGADVRVAMAAIEEDGSRDLWPEEEVAIERAVPRRAQEFATGRRLARSLLKQLGFPPGPIASNANRSPRWPPGAVGAITHTRDLCVVVAARGGPDEALGVDVESGDDLQADLRPLVCTPNEVRWIEAQPAERRGRLGKLVFSAKETLYKLQHPLTGTFLGFQQAEIEIEPDAGIFDAKILHPVSARFGDLSLEGTIVESPRWIVTAMRWPPAPRSGGLKVRTQTAPC